MMTQPGPRAQCRSCTVPIDTGDTCSFCATYTPPETTAQRLDVLVNKIDLVRHDLNVELQGLPADAPLMAVVDLVTSLGHLRQAAVALDKCTDSLEADAKVVQR
jgi:hypothetical protein